MKTKNLQVKINDAIVFGVPKSTLYQISHKSEVVIFNCRDYIIFTSN